MSPDCNVDTFPNNLPRELLAEILTLTFCPPFILGLVCSTWRHIAWSTPAIWSRITLHLVSPSIRPTRYARQVSIFKRHLARSGAAPLTLRLAMKKDWSPELWEFWKGENPFPMEFVRPFVDSAHRWRHIELDALPLEWHDMLKEATASRRPPDRFPHLHTLKIALPREYSLKSHHPLHPTASRLDLFRVAPALRGVKLTGFKLSDVDLPWHQLTSLTLTGHSRHECLYAIHEAPNLIYLEMHPSPTGLYLSGQLPSGRCLRSDLKVLILSRQTVEFYSFLSSPELIVLEIAAVKLSLDLLARYPLRRLKLCDVYISSKNLKRANIIHALREISSLEELEVDIPNGSIPVADTDIFVELLKSRPGSDTHFLPRLTMFSYSGPMEVVYRFDKPIFHQLQYRHGPAAAERNLRAMLSFRVKVCGGYRPFRSGAGHLGSKGLLKVLARGGLKFSLTCGGKDLL